MPEVRCEVTECRFWHNRQCQAPLIEISTQTNTLTSEQTINGYSTGYPGAGGYVTTFCQTYTPR